MSAISKAMRVAEANRRLNAIYAEQGRLHAEQEACRKAIDEIHAKLRELREESNELRRETGMMIQLS